jgi:hypothetical protein
LAFAPKPSAPGNAATESATAGVGAASYAVGGVGALREVVVPDGSPSSRMREQPNDPRAEARSRPVAIRATCIDL